MTPSDRTDHCFIKDILECADRITRDITGVEYEEYLENSLIQRAVLFDITTIGVASRQLSNELKNRYSEVPWRDIICMRNRVAHGDFSINHEIVWRILTFEIPKILTQLKRIDANMESKGYLYRLAN